MECRRATRTTRLIGAGAATVAFVGVAALTARGERAIVPGAEPKPIPSDCVDANGPVLQVRVPASDLRFEYDCYAVSRSPGGVVFSHRSGLSHNVAIVSEEEKPLLATDVVTAQGGADATAIETLHRSLEPGTYTLMCQVHPLMTARLEVLGS